MYFSDPIISLLRARAKAARLRIRHAGDRGGLSIEAVILVAALVGIATVAAGVLLAKVIEKTGQIK